LIENESLREKIIDNAFRTVEDKYSWARIAHQTVDVYNHAINDSE